MDIARNRNQKNSKKSIKREPAKNGKMKNHQGLALARGYGRRSMSMQAKLTAIAVNLKRITSILSSKLDSFLVVFKFRLIFCRKSLI